VSRAPRLTRVNHSGPIPEGGCRKLSGTGATCGVATEPDIAAPFCGAGCLHFAMPCKEHHPWTTPGDGAAPAAPRRGLHRRDDATAWPRRGVTHPMTSTSQRSMGTPVPEGSRDLCGQGLRAPSPLSKRAHRHLGRRPRFKLFPIVGVQETYGV
jgi:hypothetical protein